MMTEEDTIITMYKNNLLEQGSFYNTIKKDINNQNCFKKYNMNIVLNGYIIVTSSFLLLSVPQYSEYNFAIIIQTKLDTAAILFNFITLSLFCMTYLIEFIREYILQELLDVNRLMNDNYIEQIFSLLPQRCQTRIIRIHALYKYITLLLMAVSFVNIILSGIVIYSRYLNIQTYATFVTYVYLCLIKLNHLYSVSSTKNIILYSGYLRQSIQFNYLNER